MPKARISKDLNDGIYFLTPTVWNWYYLFDRHERWQILADSLSYCREHKGLRLYQYVFMLNHIHLIVGSEDIAGFLRDFKRHTSLQLYQSLEQHEPNALRLFEDEHKRPRLWKPDNKPVKIENETFYLQKANYIWLNPVKKDYVEQPEHWKWSSANPESPIEIDEII